MAITATSYELLRSLPVKRGSSLLEIGEANWYGDLDPQSVGLIRHENLFVIAKDFYEAWFSPERSVAVDLNGSPDALLKDLNQPLNMGERFDVVINHGTAEHIFNIAQVFASMHDACEVDGWLIHDAPFVGWVDHGFYCLQPTLFYDLAAANRYDVSVVAVHEFKSRTIIRLESRDDVARLVHDGRLSSGALLFVALRKVVDQPFVMPMQGYYAGTLSQQGAWAWKVQR